MLPPATPTRRPASTSSTMVNITVVVLEEAALDIEVLGKPTDVFDRDAEWADLADFALSPLPGLRIAVVYGRRRQGKSYLLRRLADAAGGLYHLATEQAEAVSLRRFGDSLAVWSGLSVSAFGFSGWEQALQTAAEMMAVRSLPRRGTRIAGARRVPLPDTGNARTSVDCAVPLRQPGTGFGRAGPAAAPDPVRVGDIGDGRPTIGDQGAARPRSARAAGSGVWLPGCAGVLEDRESRSRIRAQCRGRRHARLPGAGTGSPVPENPALLGDWLARNVLRPSMPLFDEASRVVHEDPRIRDTGTYSSVLAAVAAGESSPTKIGGLLGRPATSLAHQMTTLASAGFIDRRQDLLLDRRPVVTVADPMVRFGQLVIQPYLSDLEAGRAHQVWTGAAHTVESKILGPHFEALAAEWTARYGAAEADLEVGLVGRPSSPAVSIRRATNRRTGTGARRPPADPRHASRIHRRGQAPRPATWAGGVAQARASP